MRAQFNLSLSGLLAILFFLVAPPLYAASIPDNLRQWQAGASTNNQPASASFAGGVTADDGKNLAKTFDASQKIDVLAYIRPAPEHVGKTGSLYVVARYNDAWFMKASDGQWQTWDFQIASLVANSGPRVLQALESVVVAPQLSNLAGKFEVYVGYKVDSDVYYNAQSFGFKVNPTPPPQPDALFNDANALKLPIPSDALMVTPEEFKNQIAAGELVISSSASIEAEKQIHEEQFQKDKAFIESIANTSPYLKALAEEAKTQGTVEGDRLVSTDAGQQVLFGLGNQLRHAADVYALSQNPENALADYTQTYNLLPDNLKTSAVAPETLQGKPLAEIQAALRTLDTLLSGVPKLDGARPETQALVKSLQYKDAIKPGGGVDNNGACTSTQLRSQYWFALKNFVPPIKNQAKRGTCWAFAAIGAVESRELVQNNNPVNLSEQFLVNKVKQDWDSNDNEDGYWSVKALNTASGYQQTLVNENDWTYNPAQNRPFPSYANTCSGYTGTCSESSHESRKICTNLPIFGSFCAYVKVTASQAGIKASSARQIWANGQAFDLNRYRLLLSQGYVLIADFPVYRGFMDDANGAGNGFVKNYAKTKFDDKGKEVAGSYGNHALQIVGFLDNDTLSTLITSSKVGGGGYFIVKNSWGCGAGDGGYYYIPADYVSTIFIDLNVLQFDIRRSNNWVQDQKTPDGTVAPVIAPKTPLNVVGLRIPTDLAPMFNVSHNTADSVNLTVTSSFGEKIYDGPWNTSKQPSLLPKNSLNYSFNTIGLRNIVLVAKYGTAIAQSNFNIRVDNTAPNLVLQNSGNPVVNEAYPIIAQITDINEADATKLCANTTWAVDGADVLSSATGCQVNVKFAATGAREVRVSTHDTEGLATSKTLTLNVQSPPINPFPKVTGQSVSSRERGATGGGITLTLCSNVGVSNGKTIDLTQLGCKFFLTGNDIPRYFAAVTVENPSNEALTYDWNLLFTANGTEKSLYTGGTASSSATFELHDYANAVLVTNPCRITVKVNAPDPTRSKGALTVWTGQCTYHATQLN